MGISVSVPCGCFLAGRATRQPPCEVWWDDEGGFFACSLMERFDGSAESQRILKDFWDWTENHCEHPEARLAGGWLTRSFAMSGLREAARLAGAELLAETLPTTNDGFVEPWDCARLLPELARLRTLEIASTQIVDAAGAVLAESSGSGVLAMSRTGYLVLRGGWVQVAPDEDAPPTWQSRGFTVRDSGAHSATLIDEQTGTEAPPVPVPDWPRDVPLTSRLVRENPEWLRQICDLLTRCCAAAASNGQRMHWR